MPAVSANSSMVGAVASMVKRTIVSMPLVPRSMMRDRPPVRRSRWKRSDSSCMCTKVRKASWRTACWPTRANSASRSWLKPSCTILHDIVGDDQHHRREQEIRQRRRGGVVAGQRVGRPFEEIGHDHQHQLGDDQKHGRPDKAHLEVGPVRRPHVGPEALKRPEGRAGIAGYCLGGQCGLPLCVVRSAAAGIDEGRD